MPTHYALSEAIIATSGLVCFWLLWSRASRLAAIGIAIVALAATLGAVRFAFGLEDDFASLHRGVAQLGGILAIGLIAVGLTNRIVPRESQDTSTRLLVGVVVVALFVGLLRPELRALIVLVFAVGIVLLASLQSLPHNLARGLAAGIAAIFPLSALLVRRSAVLGPDLSWHLYHVLVAIWIIGMTVILVHTMQERDRETSR